MSSLYDFENVDAPIVNEIMPIPHPEDEEVTMGFSISCENRDKPRGINMIRYRKGDENNKQDYYRNVGGYSLLKSVAKMLKDQGAQYVFVEEADNGRLIEYQLGQFREGEAESLPDFRGCPQWCCPVDSAIHTWPLSDCQINHAGTRKFF